jgi:PAS domain S-box-containing protein
MAAVWGMAQFRLFDIVPVAHYAVIRSMSDGLIVLDPWNRVVDINPAAQRIIGQKRGGAMELEPARVLFAEPDLIVRRRGGAEEVHSEIVLAEGEENHYYDLCITPLHDGRNRLVGQLIHLSDITEHRRAHGEREKLIARLEEALAQVRALRGLLPICASCKRIRDYAGRWRGMEEYVTSHSNAEFSHGLCPECSKRLYPDFSYEGGAHHSVGA